MTSSRDGGAAACAVLTHRSLLSIIAAYQYGVPGHLAPLVRLGAPGGHTFHIFWHCASAQLVWAELRHFWMSLRLWKHTTATSATAFKTAVFSLTLPATPPLAARLLHRPPRDYDWATNLYRVMADLWTLHVLSCFHVIWRRRHQYPPEQVRWSDVQTIKVTRATLASSVATVQRGVAGHEQNTVLHQVLRLVTRVEPARTPAPPPAGAYLLFFDGGSRGNPGPGGAGSIVLRCTTDGASESLLWSAAMSLADRATTNNYAEYVGVLTGLRAALLHKWSPITVIGDSRLILRQLAFYRPPLSERLRPLYNEARLLADQLDVVAWRHHLRAYNKMADLAANVAMDSKCSLQTFHPSARPEWAGLEVSQPLVRRYETDGWMRRTSCTVRASGPDSSHTKVSIACIVSKVSGRIWPPRQWQWRCAIEASVAYDTSQDGFPLLTRLLRPTSTVARTPGARQDTHQRFCATAAAVGRVDVLQWMHATQGGLAADGLQRACVYMAMRHGQLPVLKWIKTTFGMATLLKAASIPDPPWGGVAASDAAARGHLHVIQWLQAYTPDLNVDRTALRAIVERGDVAMLRALETRGLLPSELITVARPRQRALVACAVASNQPESLAYLIETCGVRATVRTLECALALGHDAVASYLVRHHELLRHSECGPELELPVHLVQRILTHGVIGDTPSHRAVQLLLPMYAPTAIAAVLVRFAQREHAKGSSHVFELAGPTLPRAVTAYAQRVATDSLGPLGAAVLRAHWDSLRGSAPLPSDVDDALAGSTQEDTQDAVLAMLFIVHARHMALVLHRDSMRERPHCDAQFLLLCHAMCEHTTDRRGMKPVFLAAASLITHKSFPTSPCPQHPWDTHTNVNFRTDAPHWMSG